MSVNQAGVGYLGASSHAFSYHARFVSVGVPALKVLFGKSLIISGQISTRTSEQSISMEQLASTLNISSYRAQVEIGKAAEQGAVEIIVDLLDSGTPAA